MKISPRTRRRDASHPRHRPSAFTRARAHAGIDAFVMGDE